MSKGLRFLACACMMLLGGCALPVPVQIASWAIDGLLYVTTDKTVADHGVSLVTQRDCAMLRVVTEGSLCRDDAVTMIASADAVSPTITDVGAEEVERPAAFATAANGNPDPIRPEPDPRQTDAIEATPNPAESVLAATENWPGQRTGQWTEQWQAILDAAMFLDQLVQSAAPIKAASGDPWHIQGLYLGDAGGDPYMDGTYAETVLGGADDDILAGAIFGGKAARDHGSAPVQGDTRRQEPRGQARTRHARRTAGLRGRGPPDRRGRIPRGS